MTPQIEWFGSHYSDQTIIDVFVCVLFIRSRSITSGGDLRKKYLLAFFLEKLRERRKNTY